MAVRTATARKSNPKKPAKVRLGKPTNGAVKEYEVITLRIAREHKAKLLDHCAKRAKQEGKQMSFNRAIIEWIEKL